MKWDDRIGRRVKLHDLHILMTVAELGSMGKAAGRAGKSHLFDPDLQRLEARSHIRYRGYAPDEH